MTQTSEFDPHASIKRLASKTQRCPECRGTGNMPEKAYPPVAVTSCSGCSGTGRIVPFASLREPCRVMPHDDESLHYAVGSEWCEGRGWVPEPDVRVACWQIFEEHPDIVVEMMVHPELYGKYEVKEALLRAAEAWVKEKL